MTMRVAAQGQGDVYSNFWCTDSCGVPDFGACHRKMLFLISLEIMMMVVVVVVMMIVSTMLRTMMTMGMHDNVIDSIAR